MVKIRRKKSTLTSKVSSISLNPLEAKDAEQPQWATTREEVDVKSFTTPFLKFMTENPTVFHAVDFFSKRLDDSGFTSLSEREIWKLEAGKSYYVKRNGSSLIAFTIGSEYKSGNGCALVGGHVDALAARLKPVSKLPTKAGYVQLGVAPYSGALSDLWLDRDLSIGGRVLVKDKSTGKINTKLVKLDWPIARIPSLAVHFGTASRGPFNEETQMVPIIGLETSNPSTKDDAEPLGGVGSFTSTQPDRLVKIVSGELGIQDYSTIINWELELYDSQPAQLGGLDKEFIFAGRLDDKLCSYSALEGLIASSKSSDGSGIVKLVGLFDDEEIGSLLRQGAQSNFLPSIFKRVTESFAGTSSSNVLSQTYANSFMISSDVTHAVNPNFLGSYLENHAPSLNVGVVVKLDPNGHVTSDSVSHALIKRIAEKCGSQLQLFHIRNDGRSGGTIGPMTSAATGIRAVDAGIPQLSMHSIRATTGSLDPGLGVKLYKGFFDHFEEVDKEFVDLS